MGAILNGNEIHGGFLNGKLLFESVKDGDWIECPANTGKNAWGGLSFMKFDSATSSADFLTSSHGHIDSSADSIAITLPDGFQFSDSPTPSTKTLMGYMQTDPYNNVESSWNFGIKYTKTQMLIHYGSGYSATLYLAPYAGQISANNAAPLFQVSLTIKGITKV